ncbi:peptide ABC transporter substrate-binding protein [Moorena producens JHB]|uniref:Peptide ABC transporter substrate-binding protein n=1 Tax=Moorena producens (strain JHB) TaxID=1454205 RepID=A0A1D9G876_MOOP1|nr:peptide ABC transporter substrate-binding protein [Moorena producens]AOY83600.1 peptide ABC transporter substrate-binding protein [Moorena producens JHB]
MSKNFLPEPEETSSVPASDPTPTPPQPKREPVRILVIGSSNSITKIIHTQYKLGFGEISEWSPYPGRLAPRSLPGYWQLINRVLKSLKAHAAAIALIYHLG